MKEDATFYYIVWAVLLVIALVERIRNKPFNNFIISAVLMMAAVIVACRFYVGADWTSYKYIFYYGYDETGRDSIEPGFLLIRSFFFNLGFTHAVFFLFLSFLSLFAIRKAAELFGIKFFMTVFLVYYSLFFLSYQFNIVRHGLMASFVWLSFALKSKGEIRAAVVSILIALGFHMTALIFIPFLFFLDRKIPKLMVFIILSISYLTYYLQLSTRIISLFPILFELERTASFVTSEEFVVDNGLTIGSQIQVLFFLFLYFKYSTSYNEDSSFRMLVNSLLYWFLLFCVLNAFYAIISRICNALIMAMIFLFPLFIEKIKMPINRFVAESLIILYIFISFPKTFAIQEDGHSAMLPYKFEIWQLIDTDINTISK